MAVGEEDKTIMMDGGGADGKLALDGEEKAPRANLICLDDSMLDPAQKGLIIPLVDQEVTLGRGANNTHPITFQKISRNHARIYPMGGKWVIEDLNSTNGVWVDETRTKEARLRPGNYVKIGAIPFQFQLERPDAAAPVASSNVDDDGEGTMMFGTEAAAERMIDVDQEQKAKPIMKPAAPKERTTAPSVAGIKQEEEKKGGKSGLIIGLLLLIAVGGGGYWWWSNSKDTGAKEVMAHEKSTGQFAADLKDAVGSPSDDLISRQIGLIQQLIGQVEADAQRFPENTDFQVILAKLLLLDIERQMILLVRNKLAEKGGAIIARATGRVDGLLAKIPAGNKDQRETLDTVKNILALAEQVMAIKTFRQSYYPPSVHAEIKPSANEMNRIMNVRSRFVETKKHPKTNLMIAVDHPLLKNLVREVESDDLLSLNQWRQIVQ